MSIHVYVLFPLPFPEFLLPVISPPPLLSFPPTPLPSPSLPPPSPLLPSHPPSFSSSLLQCTYMYIKVYSQEKRDGSVAGETIKEEEEEKKEREGEEEEEQPRPASLAEASRPLLSAVQELETFSSCPQFAAAPAQICQEGVAMQRSILEVSGTAPYHPSGLLTAFAQVQCTCTAYTPDSVL